MKNIKTSNRSRILFGMAIGAWLNIWPSAIFHTGVASFIFAYVIAGAALWSTAMCDFVDKDT